MLPAEPGTSPGRLTEPGTRVARRRRRPGGGAPQPRRARGARAACPPSAASSRTGSRRAGPPPPEPLQCRRSPAPPGPGRAPARRATCSPRSPSGCRATRSCSRRRPSTGPSCTRGCRAREPLGYLSAAQGGLGFALPGAAGLRMALPERPIVAVVGDGAALYGVQALLDAPPTTASAPLYVVLSNGGYAGHGPPRRDARRRPWPWPQLRRGRAGRDRARLRLPGTSGSRPTTSSPRRSTRSSRPCAQRTEPLLLDVEIAPTPALQLLSGAPSTSVDVVLIYRNGVLTGGTPPGSDRAVGASPASGVDLRMPFALTPTLGTTRCDRKGGGNEASEGTFASATRRRRRWRRWCSSRAPARARQATVGPGKASAKKSVCGLGNGKKATGTPINSAGSTCSSRASTSRPSARRPPPTSTASTTTAASTAARSSTRSTPRRPTRPRRPRSRRS